MLITGLALMLTTFATPPPALPDPIAEVKSLIETQVTAWNTADLKGFCALYAEDALFISPSGITRGRQAVLDRYLKKYGGDKKGMGKLAIEVLEGRRFPSDGAAASVSIGAKWSLEWPDKPGASGLTLIVFQRSDKGWRLVQDASM